MAHLKGEPKTTGSGRKAGTPNKLTATFKQAVLMVFDNLGGVEHLTEWARANPTEFYKIAARLIPQEMQHSGSDGEPVRLFIGAPISFWQTAARTAGRPGAAASLLARPGFALERSCAVAGVASRAG
jgi:hypothetical protein